MSINPSKPMRSKSSQENIKEQILGLCTERFLSLGDIAEVLQISKHTIRAGYLYPMVKLGLLVQKHPAGTKSAQRYMTAKSPPRTRISARQEGLMK